MSDLSEDTYRALAAQFSLRPFYDDEDAIAYLQSSGLRYGTAQSVVEHDQLSRKAELKVIEYRDGPKEVGPFEEN